MYDLIIIGAGPAGSTLARELTRARADMRILMIDGMPKGGSKVCGGLLSPDAQAVLRRQGVALPETCSTASSVSERRNPSNFALSILI